MPERLITYRQVLPFPLDRVFPFFAEAANLGLTAPPEIGISILTPQPIMMRQGALIDYHIRLYGVPMRWRTLISAWEPPYRFVDEQIQGPYKQWIHAHQFSRDANGHTVMEDEVRYRMPFSPLGECVHPLVRSEIERIFAYRSKIALQRL